MSRASAFFLRAHALVLAAKQRGAWLIPPATQASKEGEGGWYPPESFLLLYNFEKRDCDAKTFSTELFIPSLPTCLILCIHDFKHCHGNYILTSVKVLPNFVFFSLFLILPVLQNWYIIFYITLAFGLHFVSSYAKNIFNLSY